MAEAPILPNVSLSRPSGSETPRHPPLRREVGETPTKTCDLIALARLVLNRDTRRDRERDRVSRAMRETSPKVEKAITGETGGKAWPDAKDERVAIAEHDGGVPRVWAEGFARLDPDRPPGDVPPLRWRCFVDDVGLFLDSQFCAVASALGWGPLDLFGCDRDRPFARIDQTGLLWLLNGRRLAALSEDAAVIEDRAGVRQTWRRRQSETGRVLAWELAS